MPGRDRVLERDVGDGVLDERALEEEVAVAFDVVDGDAAVAQLAELRHDLLDRRGA